MDGNHPKNKDLRPKRAKDKDNPYTIFTVGLNTEHPRYYLEFTDGQHKCHSLEISWEVFALFDRFELEDKRHLNEVDRHYEHADLTETEIERRSSHPAESLEDTVVRQILNEELHKAIAQLPDTQRRRLVLYYFQQLTYEQIAEMEGCRYQSVQESILSAIEKRRKYFK